MAPLSVMRAAPESIDSTFEFLYAIRRGFMKSQIKRADGSERILGFHMPGDLIGMDGTPSGKHGCDAIALENTSVCQISYLDLEELASVMPNLEQLLERIIRREVVRLYGNMLAFNEMGPGERLALFLVTLSTRYVARGYSQTRFKLHMPHQDIANHLGLTLETLSRQFSRLEDTQVIALQDGWVEIKDPDRLEKIIESYIARRDPRQSA